MGKSFNLLKKHKFLTIAGSLCTLCLILSFIPKSGEVFAFIPYCINYLIGSLTSLLPFSLFATLVCLLPMLLGLFIYFAIKSKSKKSFWYKTVVSTLCVILLYNCTIGLSYNKKSIYEKMQLPNVEINIDIAEKATKYYIDKANEVSLLISRDDKQNIVANQNFNQTAKIVSNSISQLGFSFLYDYNLKAKNFYLNDLMAFCGISGMYFPFFSEVNVNGNTPKSDLPYTIAHELSHAKGVMNEGEANFLGLIACSNSTDNFVKYSGHVNSALYMLSLVKVLDTTTDKVIYNSLVETLDKNILIENENTYKYYLAFDGILSNMSEFFNNIYLKLNGITEGTKSYSLVSVGLVKWWVLLQR